MNDSILKQSIITTILMLGSSFEFEYLWTLEYIDLENIRDEQIKTYNNRIVGSSNE